LYRAGGGTGASLYFKPVHSPAGENFARAFLQKHQLTGQFSFDLMEEADGSLAMLECNPRATSGIHLCPKGVARAFLGESVPALPVSDVAPCAAKLGVLCMQLRGALAKGGLRSMLRDLGRARDSCFRWRDPLPSLALVLSTFEILLRSRAWGVPTAQAFTFDLEWNGRP
jgi:hypothetical protein